MNKLSDSNISLIEETHKYILADDPSAEFTSATTFIKYFFYPFDSIGIANNLTSSHPKYLDMSPQELVSTWDKKAEEGTIVHAEIDKYINEKASPTRPKSKLAVEWIKENLTDRFKVYSEVIVYSKDLELAGSIDILIYDKEKDIYNLLDWKTSEKIYTSSFNSKMGNHKFTSNLMDCNYIHYSLQLTLYQYILENSYGIKIANRTISHLGESKVTSYKTDYFEREIENMLKADRTALKQKAEECLTKEFI
jgi:PD-(D/E)XK nuclease superfamily